MRAALSIAGSDPSGGAGIQADLKTFAALGVYGTCAITAVTAQNTAGVASATALPADLVAAQIEAVAGDIEIHATKIGMLADAAIVEAVAAAVEELQLPLVVVDPVLASARGDRLLDLDGVQALCRELLPRARVVTPNVPEAEALSGRRITSLESAKAAARRIHDMGAGAVIVTGGHARWSGGRGHQVVDLLFDGRVFAELRADRIADADVHGTGCTFAAAVAACLARGLPLADAAARAQQFVGGAIRRALAIGRGRRVLDHFWPQT
jgi:hydroxymethylpyrimidine/phosphomethylpyrimidine kinase